MKVFTLSGNYVKRKYSAVDLRESALANGV